MIKRCLLLKILVFGKKKLKRRRKLKKKRNPVSAVLVEVVQEVVPASVGGDLFRGRGLDLDHVTAQEGGGVKH